MFQPYVIKEIAGKKIAFVGVTTPKTIGYYSSTSLFMNAKGKVNYNFRAGKKNSTLFSTIQAYSDKARTEGADYVFLLSHFGQAKKYESWDEVTSLIAATKGIDAVIDGHSHDAKKIETPNADGQVISRIAMGSIFEYF